MSAQIFVVRKSETQKRWDPFFSTPELVALEKRVQAKASHTLRDFVVSMASGATPLKSEGDLHYAEAANGIPFIRVQNLTATSELDLSDVKHITPETHGSLLTRSQLAGDELLVKITGVGRMAVASVVPTDFVANINQHIAALKTTSKLQSEALAAYLNLDFVERLASRRATGGTRPALDYTALLSIPVIEDKRILDVMSAAYAEKKRLEDEAAELLAGVDEWLYQELNITQPFSGTGSLANRKFIRKQSAINGRLDPYYFSVLPESYAHAVSQAKYPLVALKDVTRLIDTGKTPAKDSYVEINSDDATPIIKAGSYSGLEINLDKVDWAEKSFIGNRAAVNDIFILSAAHQPEYVGKKLYMLTTEPLQTTLFVGELLRIKSDPEKIDPKYLFTLLNSSIYQLLLNREKRGQTSHLYPRDVRLMGIPLPPKAVQQKVVTHIYSIEKEMKWRLIESTTQLNAAKAKVEKMILGEAV
jgi:hypothetical protein